MDQLRYTASLYFLSGELDLASEPTLEALLGEALADKGPVTLDMSAVTFIDSSAVAAIMRALRRTGDGCLLLHGVRGNVARTLSLVGVDAFPGIHVTPCERDPYPGGQALLGPEGSRELVRKLAEMSERFRRQRSTQRTLATRTSDIADQARRTREATATTRALSRTTRNDVARRRTALSVAA